MRSLRPACPAAPQQSRNYLTIAVAAIILVGLGALGLTIGRAPAPPPTSSITALTIRIVAVLLASMALGGAIACALLIDTRWRRYTVSAAIGVIAALFYASAPTRPITGNVPGDLIAAILCTCFMTFTAASVFEGWSFGFSGPVTRSRLRATLMPQCWGDAAVTEPLAARDLVFRWFVAIAASTGSVVGALMTQAAFWDALAETLAPTRLIFTLLLAVVSITLIGPLSPRTLGRLLLVLLFSFQPALLDACVGETVSRGDINATFLILTSAIGPALITYYWSAALQRGVPSIMRQAGRSSTVLSAILWYPPSFALLLAVGMALVGSDPQYAKFMIILFIAGIPIAYGIALAWGFVLNGVTAYGGGWMLDRIRAQREMDTVKAIVMLFAVLAVINLLFFVASMMVVMLIAGDQAKIGLGEWGETMLGLLSTVGWVGGLLVSGFPRILNGTRNRPPPAAEVRAGPVIAA